MGTYMNKRPGGQRHGKLSWKPAVPAADQTAPATRLQSSPSHSRPSLEDIRLAKKPWRHSLGFILDFTNKPVEINMKIGGVAHDSRPGSTARRGSSNCGHNRDQPVPVKWELSLC